MEATTLNRYRRTVWELPWVRGLAFWLVCAAVLLAAHAKNTVDSDEGVVLNGAWQLLNGQVPYDDFFEYVAPGSFYLVFAAWKLFGAHFWIAKLLGILAIAAAVAGTYRIGLLIASRENGAASRWAFFLGPLVYCLMSDSWQAINHNTFNIAFVVGGAYFVTRSILRRSCSDACIGGVAAGIAILFLQHRGLVFAASALFALGFLYVRDRHVAWLKSSLGFLAGTVATAGAALLYWPSSLLTENLLHFPATHYLEVNRQDSTLFLVTSCCLLMAIWLLRNSSNCGVWFLVGLQGALFLTALQRPDATHVTVTLFPILSLFPLLLSIGSRTFVAPKMVWFSTGLVILLMLLSRLGLAYPSWFKDGSQHVAIQFLKRNCGSSPYIYAGPFLPGLYFETEKLNPTRYSVLLTNLNTSDQFLEAKNDIETSRTPCVITNYATVEKFNYDKNNVLDRYIASNYELALQSGPVQVLILRGQSIPTK